MREKKESGLPWIGPIPSDWDVVKFKHVFAPRNDRNPGDAIVLSLYREHGIVPKDSRDDNHNVTSLDTSKYRFVRIGDFVVNKMKAWQGSTAVSDYEGVVSPAYYVYEFRDQKTCRRYFHYLLRSRAYAQQFALLSGGIREGQWDLPADALYNIGIPVPSPNEQSRIATFLDDRCAKIDEAIARHQSMIEKLDEYRKAIITKAVTKGISEEKEMKATGCGWLQKIPKEWSFERTKFHFSNHKIVVGESASEYDRLALTLDGVIKRDKDDTDGLQPKDFIGYQLLRKDELVFKLIDLENVSTSRVGYSPYEGIVSPAYIILEKKNGVFPRYAEYYFLSLWMREIFNQLGDSGVRSSLNSKDLLELPIAFPNIDEQKAIVETLDAQCKAIVSAKERHTQLIAKLEEYKKSVIYNAVTGKIEC